MKRSLHVLDAPATPLKQLLFDYVSWPTVPELGHVLGISDRVRDATSPAVRLKEVVTTTRSFQAPDSVSPVACLIGQESLLETLWRSSGELGESLVERGFGVVVSPAFSTWWGNSPFATILALARSARVASTLAEHLPTIPTLSWRYLNDIVRIAAWLCPNPPTAIAVDFGQHRLDVHWAWGLNGLRHLHALIRESGPVPRLLVNGPFTGPRINDICAAWSGPISFASQRPWLAAVHGYRVRPDLRVEKASVATTIGDLTRQNTEVFRDQVREASQDHGVPR